MKKNIYYRFTAAILILLSISSFFIGFIYGENSAGAGGLILGDFPTLWKNLQIFLNNDITTALNFTNDLDSGYKSSRTPLLYILHAYLNPFAENKVFERLEPLKDHYDIFYNVLLLQCITKCI